MLGRKTLKLFPGYDLYPPVVRIVDNTSALACRR